MIKEDVKTQSSYLVRPDNMLWESTNVQGFSSKNLILLNNGGIKMIRIAPMADYPIHIHPDKTEFVFVLEGSISCTIAKEEVHCDKGEMVVFPIGIKHNIHNSGSSNAVVLVGNIKC